MKILITGGGGFVGSHLAEAELNAGNEVVAWDVSGPEKVAHLMNRPKMTYVRGDLKDPLLEEMIKNADLVFHLAAIASVYVYCTNPKKVLETNVEGTARMVRLCHAYNKKIVFSSSSEIYGRNPRVPWPEESQSVMDTPERTRWCYSASKIIGEHYLHAFKMEGLKMAICRFFNFYGPRLDQLDPKGRVITCFLDKFLKNETVEVVAPGDQSRCFTHIRDGVNGIMMVGHNPAAEGQAFNIGDDTETTILDLAQMIKRIGNFSSKIEVVPAKKLYGDGYEDIFRRVPDNRKARNVLGWKPEISLEDGLKETIEHFKQSGK